MFQNTRGPAALIALAAALLYGLFQLFSAGAPNSTVPQPAIPGMPNAAAPADTHSQPIRAPDGPNAMPQESTGIQAGSATGLSQSARTPPGDFDYYILALSWSPTYCLEEADPRRDRAQCGSARPFAFVLHGLWPQHERGYPEKCDSANPRVPDAIIDTVMDIMPSRGLAGHEWRQHGSCTGLSQADYFAAARAAFGKVNIPAEFKSVTNYVATSPTKIEQSFLTANPGLARDGVTVTCSRKHLREVRVCMTKEFKFRSCGSDARRDCDLSQVIMPPSRGGR